MHRRSWITLIAVAASIAVGSAQTADTILYNGKILTVDKAFSVALTAGSSE